MTARAGVLLLALSTSLQGIGAQVGAAPTGAAPVGARIPTQPPAYPPLVGGYDFRYGMVPGTDFESLVGKAVAISRNNVDYYDAEHGEKRLSGFAEFHGVYDVGIGIVKETLVDFENYPKYMPWITSGTVLAREKDHYDLRFTVGINFLGAKAGYLSLSETEIDKFPDGSLGLRSRMTESPDGSLYELYVSWYLASVPVKGRAMTYVRYYSRPGLRNPSWLVSSFIARFTEPNIQDQVASLMKESARRQKNADKK